MESLLIRENFQVSERRKRILRGEMERTLNPFKESLASNATGMDFSKKVSQLFESEGKNICHYSK